MGFSFNDAAVWAALALAAAAAVTTTPRHFTDVDGKLLRLVATLGTCEDASAIAGATGANQAFPPSP